MCGIAGVMWFDSEHSGRAVAAARDMQRALRHRGPDGEGLWASPLEAPTGLALIHTRLAVIDLSEAAGQPMRRGHEVVTYNGEIYNYRALRDELAGGGSTFSTQSDTEVLLRAWHAWGEGCLERLTGMFAFGLWDERQARLVLARDRFGIKPLYVARTDGFFAFASEIRALLASGLVRPRLNAAALPDYLGFQTAPTPETLVAGVQLLEPGTVTTVGANGEARSRSYWELLRAAPAGGEVPRNGHAVRARTRELLEESVRAHLVSDVPVGVFLSGGIDSSALLSVLRTVGTLPQTFSVTFDNPAYDESVFSREAAHTFGSDHTEFTVSEGELLDSLPDFLASVDHPSGDGVNTFVLSRLVRERGVKVAWSGLGGDELFCGYPSFARLARSLPMFRQWSRLPASVRRVTAESVRRGAPGSVATGKIADAMESAGTFASLWPLTRQLFGPDERRRLLGAAGGSADSAPAYAALLEEAAERFPAASLGALVSHAETRAYMHDVLLRDTDQMSMAHGLEVRVPLLDHRLAEWLVSLPDELRMAASSPKALLVESLETPLPENIVRRPKRGFTFPFDLWMRQSLRAVVARHLGQDGLEGRGVFQSGEVTRLWTEFLEGSRRVTWSRIWILVALNAWMDRLGLEAPR